MSKWVKSTLWLVLLLGEFGFAMAEGPGKEIFKQCSGCHQIGRNAQHQYGPALNGVMDRSAAEHSDYSYSDAFRQAAKEGLVWDQTTMSDFLQAPMQYVEGTKMAFPGLSNPSDRASLIAYLSSFDKDGKSTLESSVETPPIPKAKERRLAVDFNVPNHGELHIGRMALPEEVAAWDIDVRPDGIGLPIGQGDVKTGGVIYEAQCGSCHGDFGEGVDRWPVLAGGYDTLTEERPQKTVGSYWPFLSTVYDYIRRAMPYGNARYLSDDEVYAVTAYLLYLNELVDEEFTLTSENFSSIKLPNEQNFKPDDRKAEQFRKVTEDQLCMKNCLPQPAKVLQRAQSLDVTPDQ